MLEQRIAALTSTLENRAAAGRGRQFGISRRRAALAVGTARPHPGRQRQRLGLRPSRTARVLSAGTPGSLRPSRRAVAISAGSRKGCRTFCARSNASTPTWSRSPTATAIPPRRSRWTPASSTLVKRELSDIRFSQSETDRRTQDSLETVHNTLGHVVDRLSMIEGDLRAVRAAPRSTAHAPRRRSRCTKRRRARPMPSPAFAPPPLTAALHAALMPQPKPELPNPAALQGSSQEHFAAAPREFHAAQPAPPPIAAPMPPRAISEILEPHAAPPRAAIAPELPPDHPLEPGTRPAARVSSPSERIAASESAISEIAAGRQGAGQFVELHRRRAPRRAGRRRRAAANEKAATAAAKAAAKAAPRSPRRQGQGRRQGRPRTSPPRSARCWSAPAWS